MPNLICEKKMANKADVIHFIDEILDIVATLQFADRLGR